MLKILITLILLLCTEVVQSIFLPPTEFGLTIRDLYGSFNFGDLTMMANEWTAEGLISPSVKIGWCGFGAPVLGGSGVIGPQGSFSRTYQDLSRHNIIYFEIGVKMIGGWKDSQDKLTLKVDGLTLKSFTIQKVGDSDKSSSCTATGNDLDTRLVGSFNHSSSSVTITLAWNLSSSSDVSFAIKDVSLTPRFESYSPRTSSANGLLVLTDTLVKGTSSGSEDNGKTGCPTGYYSDGNYCFRCNAACQDCFGPSSSECYQCKWNYNFDGDQCIQCAAHCAFCSGDGSNQCLLCSPGYTLDFDGTCNADDSCNTWPFVIKTNKALGDRADFVKICEYGCPRGIFMLWNYTCTPSCEAPLVQRREGDYWCDYPCSQDQYLWSDGSCMDYCPGFFSIRMEAVYKFCEDVNSTSLGCEEDYLFKYQNGSCLWECPYPYIEEFHDQKSFCSLPCPQGYLNNLTEDCVRTCEPELIRVKNNVPYCDGENPITNSTNGCESIFDFKYLNGSCLATCPLPYRDEWHMNSSFCYPPCPNRYYDSARKICLDSCDLDDIQVPGEFVECAVKIGCPSVLDFKYPNGSCLPSCGDPYRGESYYGSNFCDSPCPYRYLDSINGECVDTCEDEFVRFGGDVVYCDGHNNDTTGNNSNSTTGCANIYDFKFPNGSCLPGCPYPYRDEWSNGSYFCYPPCPLGGYFDTLNDSCLDTCEPEYIRFEDDILYCDGVSNWTNMTNSTNGCESIYDFKYPNGSCLSSCLYPLRDEWHNGSYFCYPPCPLGGYFDTLNDSCVNSCEPEYIRFEDDVVYCDGSNNNTNSTNSTTGCPTIWDFKYPNGSCSPSCSYPRRAEWNNGSYFCSPPCPPGGYFDTLNDSCVDTCEPEDIRFEDNILYCEGSNNETNSTNSTTGCPNIYDFKYPNGSCLPNCSYPRRDEWHNGSYFCSPPCLLGGYFDTLNDSCVDTCEPEFVRFEDDIIYCDSHSDPNNNTNITNSTNGCESTYDFKYPNGSCLPSCPYPHKDEWNNGSYFCFPPCPLGGYFDTLNDSCVNSCEPEYIRFDDDVLYCDGQSDPNNSTNNTNSTTGCPNIYDFKYPNGSCLASCPYPHRDEWHNGSYFCSPPCPNKYFNILTPSVRLNENCVDSCEPEYVRFEEDIILCEGQSGENNGTNNTNSTTGCPSIWDFKYPNGSCLSSCSYPHRDEWHNGSYFCYPPCSNEYWSVLSNACVGSCEPEFIRFDDDILYCDGRADPNNSTNTTNSTTGCPSIYDFKYLNGSCLPTCPFPFRDEWYNGSYFCYPPCPNQYFDVLNESCTTTCEPEYIKFDQDIWYCNSHSNTTSPNNGTDNTNSTTGCPSIWDFKYPNGSCLSNCSYPRRDEWHNGSYFCYPPCSLGGYFDILNDSCVDTCEPEYIRFEDDILYCYGSNNDTNSTNSTTGCSSIYDFKYPNGSCLSNCPYPHRDDWHNGSYFCYPPCPLGGYFDTLNDSCVDSCKPELVRFEDDILYCDSHSDLNNNTNSTNSTIGCPSIYDFKYPNGSCLPSCPFPRRDEWHNGSYFCYPPCPNRYFDILEETCIDSCEPEFIQFEEDVFYCTGQSNSTNSNNGTNSTTGCPSIYDFKYPNGSCLSGCPYPHRDEWSNGSYFCYPPCSLGRYFDTLNDSCVNSCEPGYIRFEDNILYCDGPSDNGTNNTNSTTGCPNIYDFKYPNGSCLSNCSYPHRAEWSNGSYFCYPPCQNRYFDVMNEVCIDTCEPEYIRMEDDILYCEGRSNYTNGTNNTNSTTACPNSYDFKYSNGSCLSSCPSPYREEWRNESYFCDAPCPNNYFDILNETCVSTCEPEYIRFEDGILYCDGHSDPNNSTNSTVGCPSVWDFKYPNGSCLPSCPSPYKEEWRNGSYFCYPPCPNSYFDVLNQSCIDVCKPEFIRFVDDILFCEGQSGENNGTNNTNSTLGCPSIYEFKYPNGSCLSSCPSPYTEEWRNGSYFCDPPCPNKYFNTSDNNCVDSCEPEYIRFEDDILYCEGHSDPNNSTNSTNSTGGCPSPNDYKYSNGSCFPSCSSPHQEELYQGSYLCNPPCQNRYFDILNNSCLDTCEPQNIRIEGDIYYCDPESDPNNGTNSTNSTTGCFTISDFKYENGSCLSTCPYPYKEELSAGFYFCNAPCPSGYFDISTEACVSSCEPESIQFEDEIAICEASTNSSECSIDYAADGSATTNCTDPSGLCPTGSFLFEDYSCNETCSSDFTPYLNASCIFPCGLDGALYPDGSCLSNCSTGYTLKMEGSFQFCVEDTTTSNNQTNSTNSTDSTNSTNSTSQSYSVTVSIYVRYDIPLSDFNAQNYLQKFISLLASLLGVDPSEIVIISIKSGSTIIESKVVLTSASDSQSVAATKAKADTMDQTLTTAAGQQNLNLDGIAVLNSNFGVITPEKDQSQDSSATKKSKISKLVILIGMIVIAVVGASIAAFSFYKFKMRRTSRKVADLGRVKGYKLNANSPITDQTGVQMKKRDEEEAALFEDQSPVNARKGKIRLSEVLKPRPQTDLEGRPDSVQLQAQAQARAKKMAEMRGKLRPRISHHLEAIAEDENGNAIGFAGIMKSV